MKKYICLKILIVSLLLLPRLSYGQILKEEITLLAKLALFQESTATVGYRVSQESLNDFLQLELKIDSLKSEGFKDFIFLSISPMIENPRNINLERIQIIPNNCKEYVVAIDKELKFVYKLKGFRANDFPSFMLLLKELKYSHLSSHSRFVEKYRVERLDVECLYRAFNTKNLNKEKFECLSNCSEITTTH